MSIFFRLGLSLGAVVAQMGQIFTPPGKSKAQVWHMNAPHNLHRAAAGEFGCCTHRVPAGSAG
jgi:hypothetical protein